MSSVVEFSPDGRPVRDERGRFVPGNPGSPGRPKGRSFKQAVAEALEEDRAGFRTRMDELARSIIEAAENGDMAAARLLADRLWPARLEVERKNEPPLLILEQNYSTGEVVERAMDPDEDDEPASVGNGGRTWQDER